jgi:cellulose synthase/poly-beta-1,6-N-acetylglucosamine synthase-like glycosyltransferase
MTDRNLWVSGAAVWWVGGLYAGVLSLLAVYGFHRSYLLWVWRRLRARLRGLRDDGPPPIPPGGLEDRGDLPVVTVQLPLYNEANVAVRLLESVAAIEYPRARLEVQVLDDSTDETPQLIAPVIARLRALGLDVVHLRRSDRVGYKAGALDAGLAVAKGELVAMFDADFLPDPDFLRRMVPHFGDARVGMVQGRWGHLNREDSIFTRVGALMLDGHHVVENRVRFAAGWLFNFAGTGGMWRKAAIASSGGWQHDTLTEDLDLSYRAQLQGWRFVYRDDVVVPAELPDDVMAFRAQQFRWAKGTVQTRRKLLGRLLHAPLPFGAKAEAFFHLSPHVAYPLTMLLSVLLLPMMALTRHLDPWKLLLLDLPLFLGTTGSLAAFYAVSQSEQGRRAVDGLKDVPALLVTGVGLTPLLTRALFEGQRSMAGEFVRTPKKGFSSIGRARYRAAGVPLPWAEALLGAISLGSVAASLLFRHYFALPFAVMFAAGYGHMTVSLLGARFAPAGPPRAVPHAPSRRGVGVQADRHRQLAERVDGRRAAPAQGGIAVEVDGVEAVPPAVAVRPLEVVGE